MRIWWFVLTGDKPAGAGESNPSHPWFVPAFQPCPTFLEILLQLLRQLGFARPRWQRWTAFLQSPFQRTVDRWRWMAGLRFQYRRFRWVGHSTNVVGPSCSSAWMVNTAVPELCDAVRSWAGVGASHRHAVALHPGGLALVRPTPSR